MNNSKSLVLVIGAGASKEVDLPVGDELKRQIAQSLRFRADSLGVVTGGDKAVWGAIQSISRRGESGSLNDYYQTARHISEAMPQALSIDNFIDTHRDDKKISQCGKLAIASCILTAERKSKLYIDETKSNNRLNFEDIQDTWFNVFFQLLTENCQAGELSERFKKVTVISFNYDRCLELFLFESLKNYYRMLPTKAAELISQLTIFHPYGTVGQLPLGDNAAGINYGASPSSIELVSIAQNLQTFSEGTDEKSSNIREIRSSIRSANRIAFIGFSFHRLNLGLLYGDDREIFPASKGKIFATTLGISQSNESMICNDLMSKGQYDREKMHFSPTKAYKFFCDYSRSLALQQ